MDSFELVKTSGAVAAALATIIAALLKSGVEAFGLFAKTHSTANAAAATLPETPFQPAIDRLDEARTALARQMSVATANRWTSRLLTVGQYIIGGLLASSFVQQTLEKQFVGILGVLVLVSSLIYQHFRPDIQLRGALGRAYRLRGLIRQAEDDLYTMQSGTAGAPTVDEFRRRISSALSEIESSELQDLAIRKDGDGGGRQKHMSEARNRTPTRGGSSRE